MQRGDGTGKARRHRIQLRLQSQANRTGTTKEGTSGDVWPINYLNNLNQYLSRDGHKLFVTCVYTRNQPIADQKNPFRSCPLSSPMVQRRSESELHFKVSGAFACPYCCVTWRRTEGHNRRSSLSLWSNDSVINRSYLSSRYLFD